VAALTWATTVRAADFKPWSGDATPALELQDLQGRTHRLADYRGRVVLVNFWATWCEPCREEMPSMDRLRGSLAGQPFEILAVNLAEPLSRVERFLEKMPLGFPVLRDSDEAAAKAWRARVLPASYLVGKDGKVRWVVVGELDWTSAAARARITELLD
jgi:thiol-disulfide isomerase/thioredoxin